MSSFYITIFDKMFIHDWLRRKVILALVEVEVLVWLPEHWKKSGCSGVISGLARVLLKCCCCYTVICLSVCEHCKVSLFIARCMLHYRKMGGFVLNCNSNLRLDNVI